MAKMNYDELSIEKLKKLKLTYNLIGLLGLIIALIGLALFEFVDQEKFRIVFYVSLGIFMILSFFRNRAITINKILKSRKDN